MDYKEFDSADQQKFLNFINESLVDEKALALISKRLQDAGLSHESAKELIQEQALLQAAKTKKDGLIRLSLGAGAMVILFLVGYKAEGRRNFYALAAGAFIGGTYMFFKSRKRLSYLNKIFKS